MGEKVSTGFQFLEDDATGDPTGLRRARDGKTFPLAVSGAGTLTERTAALNRQVATQGAATATFIDSMAAAIDEQWANLGNWVLATGTNLQVSGGKLYANGAGGNSAANRSLALASGDTARLVAKVNTVGTLNRSGGIIVGVNKDAAGAAPSAGGSNSFGIYLRSNNATAQQMDSGAATDLTGQPAMLTDKSYVVTVSVDATYISVVAVETSAGTELRCRKTRAAFGSVNNFFVFNSDANTLTGFSIDRLGARKAVASVGSAVEAFGERVHWSGDGTNDFKLHLPTSYDSRKPLKLVMCFHGNGSDENHWATNANGKTVKDALVAAGYAVLGCTYAANKSTWGAQVSLDAYVAAFNRAASLYPVGSVCFYANSMGGIESLLSLAERRIPGVCAWVGTSPTTNLADNYTSSGAVANGFPALIDTAYGINGGNPYATATAGHDPMLLPVSAFRGIPMLFLAATDDTVVAKASNTDVFVAKLGSANATTVQAGITGGHSFSFSAYTSQIVAFFNAALA